MTSHPCTPVICTSVNSTSCVTHHTFPNQTNSKTCLALEIHIVLTPHFPVSSGISWGLDSPCVSHRVISEDTDSVPPLPKAPSGIHLAPRTNPGGQPVRRPVLSPPGHTGLSHPWAHKAGSHPRAFALAIHLPVTPSPQISTEPLKALVSCSDLSSPDCPSARTPTYTTASTCWPSFPLHALTTVNLTQSYCLLLYLPPSGPLGPPSSTSPVLCSARPVTGAHLIKTC